MFILPNPEGILVRTRDGHNFRIAEPFTYVAFDGRSWTVQNEDATDGASTPSFIWSIPGFAPFGLKWPAAVVHDYLYRYTKEPKAYCDKVFLTGMVELGVDATERILIYEAVKLAGEKAFNADRTQENN